MPDHATSEIAIGSKLGIDATKKISGEGFKHPWPPLIKMDKQVQEKSVPSLVAIVEPDSLETLLIQRQSFPSSILSIAPLW